MTYWDGSAWQAMVMTSHVGSGSGISMREALKNPLSHRAGITQIVTFKNPDASLTLGPRPVFCALVGPSSDPSAIMIGTLDVKKDHRELETCAGPCASKGRGSDDWMPEKRVQPAEIKRTSTNTVEITPKNPLQPGQYLIGAPPFMGYFDFGVSGAAVSK